MRYTRSILSSLKQLLKYLRLFMCKAPDWDFGLQILETT